MRELFEEAQHVRSVYTYRLPTACRPILLFFSARSSRPILGLPESADLSGPSFPCLREECQPVVGLLQRGLSSHRLKGVDLRG